MATLRADEYSEDGAGGGWGVELEDDCRRCERLVALRGENRGT